MPFTFTKFIEYDALLKPVNQAVCSKSERLRLRTCLGINGLDTMDDDLAMFEEPRLSESCSWFIDLKCFKHWLARDDEGAPVLWLKGAPGMGKSVIFGHVTEHLRQVTARCSYHAFRHDKSGTRTMASMLMSMAFQMATQDRIVFQSLSKLMRENVSLKAQDTAAAWQRLLITAIFNLESVATHFWVIDGLDESLDPENFFKLASVFPQGLRVLVSSRSTNEIDRGITSLATNVYVHTLAPSDTMGDMEMYVRSRLAEMSHQDSASLMQQILSKANGSFLWARLVTKDLAVSFTAEEIDTAFKNVPDDLNDVYTRILRRMEKDERPGRIKLVKSILTWVALAARPLSIRELQEAVKLDIDDEPQQMKQAIIMTCGQLLVIDPSSHVHLVHETAKTFLLDSSLSSKLAVREPQDHANLFLLCLKYLTEFLGTQPPFRRRRSAGADQGRYFLRYASTHLSHHLCGTISGSLEIFSKLTSFLNTMLPSFIEYHAEAGDLSPVTKTATNLSNCLENLTEQSQLTSPDAVLVKSWVTDMIQICSKFGKQLLISPSSIHLIIPGLAPVNSEISRRFSMPSATIGLTGARELHWDDCLMRMDYQEGMATCVSHGIRSFAVGRSNGNISLHDAHSLQTRANLQHPGRVWRLKFSVDDMYLASSGKDTVVIWDLTSSTELRRYPSEQALALSFTPNLRLLLSSNRNMIISINIESDDVSKNKLEKSTTQLTLLPDLVSTKSAFSPTEGGMLALAYRSYPVMVVDVDAGCLLGQCSVGWNNGVNDLVFNPSADIPTLVVAYTDGDLVTYDTRTFTSIFTANHVYANALDCTPDGRALLAGSNSGWIEIYAFSGTMGTSLKLMHRINNQEPGIRGLACGNDGTRFVSICSNQCRVWKPAASLHRDTGRVSQSHGDASALPIRSPTLGMMEASDRPELTAIASVADEDVVICGRSDGQLIQYSTEDGKEVDAVESHAKGVSIILITISVSGDIVATADSSARVLVHTTKSLSKPQTPQDTETPYMADIRFETAISQIMLDPKCQSIIISGASSAEMWDISRSPGHRVGTLDWQATEGHSILQHPSDQDLLLLINEDDILVYCWKGFSSVTRIQKPRCIEDQLPAPASSSTTRSTYRINEQWLVEMKENPGCEKTTLRIAKTAEIIRHSDNQPLLNAPVAQGIGRLESMIRNIIALVDSTLYFLDRHLWICSIDLSAVMETSKVVARRHFFILPEWLSVSWTADHHFLCAITGKHEVVFAANKGIVVVKGGFEFSETVTLEADLNDEGRGNGSGVRWRVVSGSMHRRTLGPASAASATAVPRPPATKRMFSAN
jgi:WD40 repeat protein